MRVNLISKYIRLSPFRDVEICGSGCTAFRLYNDGDTPVYLDDVIRCTVKQIGISPLEPLWCPEASLFSNLCNVAGEIYDTGLGQFIWNSACRRLFPILMSNIFQFSCLSLSITVLMANNQFRRHSVPQTFW